MTIAPGTNIHPAMSPWRVLELFPVGTRVQSTQADRGIGTVSPASDGYEGTAAKAYGQILGMCVWVNVVWDNGYSTAEFPGHLELAT